MVLQTKNGALDFQPSEPAQPLFGSMKYTSLMPELQITQEYTGHSTYLVYLLPMWREFLDFDTYSEGRGSTVERVLLQVGLLLIPFVQLQVWQILEIYRIGQDTTLRKPTGLSFWAFSMESR